MMEAVQDFEIGIKRRKALETVDNLPGDLRACVHEFGYPIVDACLQMGVRKPANIRQLVHVIWTGAREPHQRHPTKNGVMTALDWVLMQSGCDLSALSLWRILRQAGWAIVPTTCTNNMVEASLAEVSDFTVRCTKPEKHRRRLEAAIKAFAKDVDRKIEATA